MKKILITGALGQIGSELVPHLQNIYGESAIISTDVRKIENHPIIENGIFEELDVLNKEKYSSIVNKYKVDTIIHMAALLSATAEQNPLLAWNLNMNGLINTLEICRELGVNLFHPSSIASFGPTSPQVDTPQNTIERPTTMYGVTKVAGELLCDYYFLKYQVDSRGLRFPGLISNVTLPGGGTTDYAVSIYYDAVKYGKYTSYIAENTYMPMMYMPDALNAIVDLMEANPSNLKERNAFNISSMSFSPEEIASSIAKIIPNFQLSYNVDPLRQAIANSWPQSLDCSEAKKQWNFTYKYDIDSMSKDMITKLQIKLKN